jgi:hypothetical protein
MRWVDGVEKYLRNLGVINWKTKAQERDGWRKFLEQAKNHKGPIIIIIIIIIIIKFPDDGVSHSELLGFRALSIVQYSKN